MLVRSHHQKSCICHFDGFKDLLIGRVLFHLTADICVKYGRSLLSRGFATDNLVAANSPVLQKKLRAQAAGDFRINSLIKIPSQMGRSGQPRANGRVDIATKKLDGDTKLARLHQSGSFKCLFPRVANKAFEAILLNTAGGVTGGDRFSFAANVGAESKLTVSTQAFERAYRAQPGETAKMNNRLHVGRGARINWLPQETLLFNGSSLERQLLIELQAGASALVVEPLVFGRAAMGEKLSGVFFKDRIEIRRAGKPLYLDALKLGGQLCEHLASKFIANGAGAMASLVYVANDATAHLASICAILPETAGASLLFDDVLVVRVLAEDSFELRQTLIPVLTRLHGGDLPRCWII
jgi:urease accessory protein